MFMYNNDEMQLMRDGRQSTDEALGLVLRLKLEKKISQRYGSLKVKMQLWIMIGTKGRAVGD